MDLALKQSFSAFLSSKQNIVIVTHKDPDGDAIGSSLALCFYLKEKGHQASVIIPNRLPDFLKWLPDTEQVIIHEQDPKKSSALIENSTIVFIVDCNAFHRTGNGLQKILSNYKNNVAVIDHHLLPEVVTEYGYIDAQKSSTCEMIYNFIEHLGDEAIISKKMGVCIYTGILTDTASFRFPSTSSETHRIASKLIDLGVDNALIYDKIYNENNLNRLKLLGKALENITVVANYRVAYIAFSQKELNAFNYKKGDTEGFVNYALSIKNIIFVAMFTEDSEQNIIKISFRSRGDFSVNNFSRNHFQGGGHKNASGGKSDTTLQETIAKFTSLLPTYKSELAL